jgi:protein-disulfide isomerase
MSSKYTVPIAIIIGGAIVAGAVYFSLAQTPKTSSGTGNPALVRPVGASDHILGNPAAPIMIIEYADFDCDYCKGFEQTLQKVIANAGADGNVAWVYRQFPLTELHPNALKHAEAAECVAKVSTNEAFWKFADLLYARQPVDPSQYGTLAAGLGISGSAFTNCYTNAATEVDARIMADRQNALDSGAVGTPYSLIVSPGKVPIVLDGAYTEDALVALINQVLRKN